FVSLAGYKLERDRSPSESELAASLTRDVKGHDIKRVFEGKDPLHALFNADQEALVAALATAIPWSSLVLLGPVQTRVWKRPKTPGTGLAVDASVEHWRVPGGELIEVSARVDDKDGDTASASLAAFLTHLGLDARGVGHSKTDALLDAFAPVAVTVPSRGSP
ncbi:MAG TPA: hypothetical protein VGO62_03340, partial [Myxococcota bacterium]